MIKNTYQSLKQKSKSPLVMLSAFILIVVGITIYLSGVNPFWAWILIIIGGVLLFL